MATTARGASGPGVTVGPTSEFSLFFRVKCGAGDSLRAALRARAADAAGHIQPAVPPWNRRGYGNTAVEVIVIDVG